MDERDRKELARLIASGIRRIRDAVIDSRDKAMINNMHVAVLLERRIVASMVRGVLDEISIDGARAAEIERLIITAKWVEAHDALVRSLQQRAKKAGEP